MTIINTSQFTIEQRHLTEGLSPAEIFALTGLRVKIFTLDTFPYWDKVVSGDPLSPEQKKERGKALTEALLTCHDLHFAEKKATKNLTNASGFVSTNQRPATFFPNIANTLTNAQRFPLRLHVNSTRHITATHASILKREPDEIEIPNEHALVFVPPLTMAAQNLWQKLSGLPAPWLKHFPHDRHATLGVNLHELRHLMLANSETNDELRFWNERECDRFALRSIAGLPDAQETTKAWLHFRYLGMLTSSERYWVAPHLQADLENRAPPSRVQVINACKEIRRTLYFTSLGRSGSWFSRKKPEYACDQYKNWMKDNIKAKPEVGFPLLRKAEESGAFDDQPLTRTIARKILAGAEYFSPGLSFPKM